jgi:hypothetical protein
VRTTVTIDDKLLELVKDRAREQGVTLGVLFEKSLRLYLARPAPTAGPPLPVFHGDSGFAPGIDPSSNVSMLDAADEAEGLYE